MSFAAMSRMRPDPTPGKGQEVTDSTDRAVLLRRLKRFRTMSNEGERERTSRDRKGANLFRGQMWSDGVTAGRLAITANQAVCKYERMVATITRNEPEPVVEAINAADDGAAELIEGALKTAYRSSKMHMKLKRGQRLCGFTRPILHYVHWRHDLRGGIGDIDSRLIPAHRCIIDNRFQFVRDMEYHGFREKATRAKLIQLFPDKADAIEAASQFSAQSSVTSMADNAVDPLKPSNQNSSATLDRLVASSPMGPFTGKTTVRIGNARKQADPLAQEVEVEYLWLDDPTPLEERIPKLNTSHEQVMEIERDEDGRVQWDINGEEVVDGPFGPMHVPKVEPRRTPVFETVIRKKYKYWRYIAWIPQDECILWDVAWNGPSPCVTQRDSFALDGYWSEGTALRLISLGIAYNILYSIIFQRLKLSLAGTFLATNRSGLKRNKLTPEDGTVFYAQMIDEQNIRHFPHQPLDPAYFTLLSQIEKNMADLLGETEAAQGKAAGRADSPQTYDKLIEMAGVSNIDRAQMLEEFIIDWCNVALWYMQTFYTHEHYVEVESAEGVSWKAASALAMQGEYAVKMQVGQMASESMAFDRAKELLGMGIYSLPMFVKAAHVPHGMRALQEKGEFMRDPSKQYLLGAAGAPPAQQAKNIAQSGKRSHHAPRRS